MMKPLVWWRKCQKCGSTGNATGGRQATKLERKIYYRCKNPYCGNRWVVLIQQPQVRLAP